MKHGYITSIQNIKPEHAVKAHWLNPPKKFKRVPSGGQMMASFFWNSQGIIMIDSRRSVPARQFASSHIPCCDGCNN
jgi:hypothetical protein